MQTNSPISSSQLHLIALRKPHSWTGTDGRTDGRIDLQRWTPMNNRSHRWISRDLSRLLLLFGMMFSLVWLLLMLVELSVRVMRRLKPTPTHHFTLHSRLKPKRVSCIVRKSAPLPDVVCLVKEGLLRGLGRERSICNCIIQQVQ